MKKKYLYVGDTGLNDCFSGLSYCISVCKLSNIDLNQVYFHARMYEDLDKYLNFKHINYINDPTSIDAEEFINFPNQPSGLTNLNWGTNLHLRNFVSFNSEILQEAKQYFAPIGVHFRFSAEEQRHKTEQIRNEVINKEFVLFKNKFMKIYSKKSDFFCCSDSSIFNNFLQTFDNVKSTEKNTFQSFPYENRKINTKLAILDLAVLSNCNMIYFTRGKFCELAVALNQHVKQNILMFNQEKPLKYLL